jgi:hypothetical protein
MSDKYTMSAQELESISDEMFNSFDPEQELWIIGGSTKNTTTTTITYSPTGVEADYDYDINWA